MLQRFYDDVCEHVPCDCIRKFAVFKSWCSGV